MMSLSAFFCLFVAGGMQVSHGWVYQGQVSLYPPQPRTTFLAPHTTQQLASPAMEQNSKEDGVRGSDLPAMSRIVGGTEAKKHEFPWQASLQVINHICGASVINEQWLMTAAHCYKDVDVRYYRVVVGEHQLSQDEGDEQRLKVENFIVHPEYDSKIKKNDIALVKLTQPLELNGKTVSAINLPSSLTTFTGDCKVAGWGLLDVNASLSDVLMKMEVSIVTDEECRNIFEVNLIHDSNICAGYIKGGKGACMGDSGGGLVCKGQDNQDYVAGVVSWGCACALPNYVDVYTEVSYFVDWINDVISSHTAGEGQ